MNGCHYYLKLVRRAALIHTKTNQHTEASNVNQAVDLDELTLFRDMARRAFDKEITPFYEEWEQDHMVPRQLWNTLGAAGLLCPDVDETYGGAGATPHVTLAMIEELSRMGFGGFASGYGIHSNIVAPYLSRHGTEAQKAHWLPRMVTGDVVGALAMTEPGAGSNVQGSEPTRSATVMNGSSMAQRYSSQTAFTLISLSSRRLLTPARVQKVHHYSSLTRMRRALRNREKLTRSASMRRTQPYCSSRMFVCLQTRCLVKRTRALLF